MSANEHNTEPRRSRRPEQTSSKPTRVPDVRPFTIRLDDATADHVRREADRIDISAAEYIRRATVAQLAWNDALEAVRTGVNLDDLTDTQRLCRLLVEVARQINDD